MVKSRALPDQTLSAVFSLPIATRRAVESDLPLGEHAGLLLVSGLMYDDLDDQQDTVRAALEIDPLLSTWTTCVAHQSTGANLSSMDAAGRWLAQLFAATIGSPSRLVPEQPHDAAQRAVWQSMVVTAIATARQAWRLASRRDAASPSRAMWLGQLCSTYQRIHDVGRQNGRIPRLDLSLPWPSWLMAEIQTVRRATDHDPTQHCVRVAMQTLQAHPELATELVSQQERELWFRPYPEFRMLVPLLLEKLRRLASLEERFEESLQREKLASLKQLAYGASHEINNPLANISTRAQTLLSNEHSLDRRRKLMAINEQAFRAHEMIADLMLFAKPPRLEPEEVALDRLIDTLRDELEPIAARRGTRLKFSVAEGPLRLTADPVQIAIAIKAICMNGLEVMQQGGVLSLQVVREAGRGDHVEITISDTGPGLSEQARRHLFDPFYSGREAGRGLGFGLSKAWRIVEQHGGTIAVSSQTSRGCTFSLVLPLTLMPT